MAQRHRGSDNTSANRASVCLIPPGSRMRCKDDGVMYQLGGRASSTQFWMMREEPSRKGLVHVNTIMDHFEVVKSEAAR